MLKKAVGLLLMLALALFIGCGSHDSSDQTDMEKGIAALDAGNWTEAISIFSAMPPSAARDKYLSSAYAGMAGLDLITIVTQIDQTKDIANSNILWVVTQALVKPDVNGYVSQAVLNSKINTLDTAVNVHLNGLGVSVSNLTTFSQFQALPLTYEQKVQLGMEAAYALQLKLMDTLVVEGSNPPQCYATQGGLKNVIAGDPTYVQDSITSNAADKMVFAQLSLVMIAADAIKTKNTDNSVGTELTNVINNFGVANPDALSQASMVTYLNSVIK